MAGETGLELWAGGGDDYLDCPAHPANNKTKKKKNKDSKKGAEAAEQDPNKISVVSGECTAVK